MISSQSLKLIHFFPDHMNIYGDMGNIITLRKRCEWRGIHVEYVAINSILDFEKITTGDIFFFGGGQDTDQMRVWNIISERKELFVQLTGNAVTEDKVFLLICGGYQMFGKSFIDGKGNAIPGLGLLDIETHAPGSKVSERCIGNIVIETKIALEPRTIVGFENHGGQTKFLKDSPKQMQYLGKVLKGFGNDLTSGHEGCMYRNVIGTYLHGSILPKNPHLADYLIAKALTVKYQEDAILSSLDDTLEKQAHTTTLRLII
jgi:CobQ-like glutamine amidotransferase family enzyme